MAYYDLTEIDSLTHDNVNGDDNSLIQLDETHLVLAYSGEGDDGYIKTFSMNADYSNITELYSVEFNTNYADYINLLKYDDDHVILAYRDSGDNVQLVIFAINESYELSETSTTSVTISYGYDLNMVKINSNRILIVYDTEAYIWTRTFEINESYGFSNIFTKYQGIISNGNLSTVQLDETHYMTAYQGRFQDGYITTYTNILPSTSNIIQNTEHDTNDCRNVSLLKYDDTHVILFYNYTNTKGYLKVFTLNPDFTFTETQKLEVFSGSYASISSTLINNRFICVTAVEAGVGVVRVFTLDETFTASEQYNSIFSSLAGYTSLVPLQDGNVAIAYEVTDGTVSNNISSFSLVEIGSSPSPSISSSDSPSVSPSVSPSPSEGTGDTYIWYDNLALRAVVNDVEVLNQTKHEIKSNVPFEIDGEAKLTDYTDMGTSDESLSTKYYVDTELDGRIADGTAQGQMAFYDATLGKWTYTETSELFWDDTNKRVGIGTASPDSQVHIQGNSTDGVLHLSSSSDTEGGMYLTGTSDNIGVVSAGAYYDRVADAWRAVSTEACNFNFKDGEFYISEDTGLTVGNTFTPTKALNLLQNGTNTRLGLGLGATDPAYTIHAKAESGNGFITLYTEDTSAIAGIALGDSIKQYQGQVQYDNATDKMNLKAYNNTIITLDGINERVGIGTGSPTKQLSITKDMHMVDTFASDEGVIYKGDYAFMHNYAHPTGDTAIPKGRNLFLGPRAGNFTMGSTATSTDHASFNIAIGDQSFISNTIGYSNVAIGYLSMAFNSEGYFNVGLGAYSLYSNTTGKENFGLGYRALYSNQTGDQNVAIGYYSLWQNTTDGNVAIGYQAMYGNVDGGRNVAIGNQALYTNIDGDQNVALGEGALFKNSGGSGNFGLGYRALYDNVGGLSNIGIGQQPLADNTEGDNNIGIGSYSLWYTQTGNNNVAIGRDSGRGTLNNSFSSNSLFGYQTGYSLSTGSSNIFLGNQAGYRQTTNSNLLIIDNQTRADVATEASNAILYGTMASTPASQSLRINAGIRNRIRTITSDDTSDTGDYTVLLDGTSSTVTLTLPTAVGIEGQIYNIKSIDTTYQTDIATNGSEEIDGDSTNLVLSLHETITIQSDGNSWWII